MQIPLSTRAKFVLKLLLAAAFRWSGMWLLWKHVVLRRRAVVLTYHRVLPDALVAESWSHPGIVVTTRTFERHMRLLRRWFNVLTLPEFAGRMRDGRPFEPGSCLVTFDDGWYDTYTEAWPVMKRYGIPLAVFLPVGFIGSPETFWQEALGRLLFAAWRRTRADRQFAERARATLTPFGLESVLDAAERDVRLTVMEVVRSKKRTATGTAADALKPLRALLGVSEATDGAGVDRFMTWEQAREMSADSVAFGAHGMTHRLLTTLTRGEVEREVAGSRGEIARRLHTTVAAFCYPNGNWSQDVAHAVERGGFAIAFSTRAGRVDAGRERFSIRRINVHEGATKTPSLFLARVLGVL